MILLSGFKGSGKDTFAKMLSEELEKRGYLSKRRSLAFRMKHTLSSSLKLDISECEDEYQKERVRETPLVLSQNVLSDLARAFNKCPVVLEKYKDMEFLTLRSLLQFVGTEALRDNYGVDIHCETLMSETKGIIDSHHIIVTDLRFENEVRFFDGLKLFVCNDRKTPEYSKDLHRSEKYMFELKKKLPNIDNNGSLEDLRICANSLVKVLESQGKL